MQTPSLPTPVRSFFGKILRLVRSIRFRLALWFVVILGMVLLAFCGFVYKRQVDNIKLISLDQLESRAAQVQTLFRPRGGILIPGGQVDLQSLAQYMQTSWLQRDEIVLFVDGQGKVLQSAGPSDPSMASELATLSVTRNFRDQPFIEVRTNTGKDYFFVFAPILLADDSHGMMVFGGLADPGGQLARLRLTLILASLVTLTVALLGGYWMADRAMRPVRMITRTAHQIGETDLSRRLNLHSQDELGELADTFDGMLDRLQAAFDRQRQFTADASHELRTPLTIVNLEADRALATRRSADEYQHALNIIRSENNYMIGLVNDLLTLARMDAGQANVKPEELDLSDLALEVVERLAPLAASKQVDLSTGPLPELEVMGDRQYLIQMLTNLVENAIKYATGDGKRVTVETGITQNGGVKDKETAWVRVADNGPGIPTEDLPHLFDRFYRVDKARSREGGDADDDADGEAPSGSGLGLSIVQWIVKAHGGQVQVSSEVGRGTEFEVTIPLLKG